MRKLVAVLLCILLVSLVCAVGCDTIQQTIQQPFLAPESVRIDGDVLRWNSVSGTSTYAVYDGEYEIAVVNATSYDLTKASLSLGDHNLSVKAKGDGTLKLDSSLSLSVIYTVTTSNQQNEQGNEQNIGDDQDPGQVSTDSKLNDRLFELGLGYGVNALNANSATSTLPSNFIDESAFIIREKRIGSSKSTSTVRSSIKDELTSVNSKLVWGTEAQASYAGMFTAGFSTKFSLEAAASSNTQVNQLYYTINFYKIGNNYVINNYTVKELFYDSLTSHAITALQKVESGAITPEVFFNTYGTHLLMAVSYGAMVNVNYAYFSKNEINQAEIMSALDAKFSASGSGGLFSASGSTEIDTQFKEKYAEKSNETWTSLYVEGIGGEGFYAVTFDDLVSHYADWANQVDDKDNYEVVDVCDGGLVPIWDYIPDQYQSARNILRTYFYETASFKAQEIANEIAPPAEKVVTKTYDIELTPNNCNDNNGFDITKPSTDETAKNEINPHIVDLYICGCEKNEDGDYIVRNAEDFEVGFRFVQGTSGGEIELTHIKGSGVYSANISDDSFSDKVLETKINKKQGMGSYYYKIYYKNGKTGDDTNSYKCDFMRSHSKDDTVQIITKSIIDDGYELKDVDKIKITCVYEIAAWWKDFLGWVSYSTITNWRCDYTIQFE